MTTASSPLENFFDFQPSSPSPSQDSELLESLSFVPGLKEILMLRQVHALEHATVWVLSEIGNPAISTRQLDDDGLGGLSTEHGFYLYGQINRDRLHRAVQVALQRLTTGEWDLALHPRCGTNLSVAMLLTAGVVLSVPFLVPANPIGQVLGFGIAATTANQLAPDLGKLAQRHLTTSIPFNLAIEDITTVPDMWGRSAQFVRVSWLNRNKT